MAQTADHLETIVINLPETLPVFPEHRNVIQRRLMGDPPVSLWDLDATFARLAQDDRVQTVVLVTRGLSMPFADVQSLRGLVARLRDRGKRVVFYAHGYDLSTYYVASAASEIVLLPGGEVQVLGLHAEMAYLREALDVLGVEADVVAISPYKNAAEPLTNAEASPATREQLGWMLDSLYGQIVADIAAGRGTSEDAVLTMIDEGPHLDRDALAAGYVDAIRSEDDLFGWLGSDRMSLWDEASRKVVQRWQRESRKVIAVLPLTGMIVDGEGRQPPADIPLPFVGAAQIGDRSVQRQIRALTRRDDVAAVVLHIESGGGSAAASEAMAAALDTLARKVPVVACLNGVAASGGYYIALPAQWIVAQPGTLTGSIGVISAKMVNAGLLDKLRINPFVLLRGANADFLSSRTRFSEAQREKVRQSIERTYGQFVDRVAAARGMTFEAVDAVGGGRVWTGAQALEHGLVDELGGLSQALAKARDLAGLPDDAPVEIVREKAKPIAPQWIERADPAASLRYVQGSLDRVLSGSGQMLLPFTWKVD